MATKLLAKPVIRGFATITTSYTPVTAAGFLVYQIQISNGTNQDVQISFDGVNDAIFINGSGGGGGGNNNFFSIPPFRNLAWPSTVFIKASVGPASGSVVFQYVGCSESAFETEMG